MDVKRLNGVTLHYTVSGDVNAPAMVFANSLGTDFRVWDRLIAALQPLPFRTVRYDKRGHGLSEAPPAPYRMDDHVGDLAALLDSLCVRNAVIVGLSVGGLIAQGLAASRPDLVRALVFLDTAHKIGTTEAWNARIAAVQSDGIASIEAMILERWFSRDFRTNRTEELAGWRAMLTRTPADGYAGTGAAIRDTDFTETTSSLRLPTLCVAGEEDGSTPPEVVRGLADLIPGSRFEVIAGAGHLPCVEKPLELAALIKAFLRDHSIPAG